MRFWRKPRVKKYVEIRSAEVQTASRVQRSRLVDAYRNAVTVPDPARRLYVYENGKPILPDFEDGVS